VRLPEIELGPDRDDAGRIQLRQVQVVAPDEVIEVDRRGNPWRLVEVAQVRLEVVVVDQAPPVAAEQAVVDKVEAHQRGERPPVGQCVLRAGEVPALSE